jgi:hypothetical protein
MRPLVLTTATPVSSQLLSMPSTRPERWRGGGGGVAAAAATGAEEQRALARQVVTAHFNLHITIRGCKQAWRPSMWGLQSADGPDTVKALNLSMYIYG